MRNIIAALFDLDGVIIDTEPQYTEFWSRTGKRFFPEIENFSLIIKGNTITQIFEKYFPDQPEAREELLESIDVFENQMTYCLIDGIEDFLANLRSHGVKTAIVTSSDGRKMRNLERQIPGLVAKFDTVITAEKVTRSKPDPQGYLLAAAELGASPDESVVFEDSFAGLAAGRAARMLVVGLSTTLSAEQIGDTADLVGKNFVGLTTEQLENI